MATPHPELRDCTGRLYCQRSATGSFLGALLLAGLSCVNAQDRGAASPPSRPIRFVTIQGQVSLPDGRPAGRALVKITTRGGVPRETFTNDQGRFEVEGMAEGGYVLSASSLTDPSLTSDVLDTDTSRTATGNLHVTLILHPKAENLKKTKKPGVITAAETRQKIPKPAHKAFLQGLKLKKEEDPKRALESFNRAIELYPEYFQALAERGDLYVLQRKLIEAGADFERALKIEAQYGPALRGSGYCKLERREFVEAAKDLERSLSTEPDNASTHLLLGIARLEQDQRDAARQSLQKALILGALRAHIYLADLSAREHLYQQAADELHLYLEAQPLAPDASELRAVEARWRSRIAAP